MFGTRTIRHWNMTVRHMRTVVVADRQVPIFVATKIPHLGIMRLVDAMDRGLLDKTPNRVESALAGDKLLTETGDGVKKDDVGRVILTSLDHESDGDIDMHTSIVLHDHLGGCIGTAHITQDEDKQEAARAGTSV